jgi:transcriptional regulator with XRE-family HTH domain
MPLLALVSALPRDGIGDGKGGTFGGHSRYRRLMGKNVALIAARTARNLSQDELAHALREAAERNGDHLAIGKKTVYRWEQGASVRPRPAHVRALEAVMRLPIEALGFPAGKDSIVVDDGRGGLDLEVRMPPVPAGAARPPAGDYSGVWLSRYKYVSSSREEELAAQHFVVLQQDNEVLSVRSLPGSANSVMGMDLRVDANIVTGTWYEDTDPNGYYRGRRYFGAIQMIADASGSRLSGKWLGAGKDNDVNMGPWWLDYQGPSTKANIAGYDRRPND